jgi:hypothetical protein
LAAAEPVLASLLAAADSEAAGTACAAPSLVRHIDLRSTVVLDFGGLLRPLLDAGASSAASGPVSHADNSTAGSVAAGGAVLAYRDLAPLGCVSAAAAELFDALRWTETVPGAKAVLVADPLAVAGCAAPAAAGSAQAIEASAAAAGQGQSAGGVDVDALRDRMFRAASGRVVAVQL